MALCINRLKMDLTNISLNMGVVEMNEKFNIYFSIRSPMESAKDELSKQIEFNCINV